MVQEHLTLHDIQHLLLIQTQRAGLSNLGWIVNRKQSDKVEDDSNESEEIFEDNKVSISPTTF